MTFDEFQQSVFRTANAEAPVSYFGLGLAGETGELVELVKKSEFHGRDIPIEKFVEEAGDVLFYLAALVGKKGLTLEDVAQANVEKLLKRYPNGFVPGGGIR